MYQSGMSSDSRIRGALPDLSVREMAGHCQATDAWTPLPLISTTLPSRPIRTRLTTVLKKTRTVEFPSSGST